VLKIITKKESEQLALPSLALALGYIAIKDLEKKADQVDVLTRLGYGNYQIGQICGLSATHVAVVKTRLKQKHPGRGR
jgi:hypothetical protein